MKKLLILSVLLSGSSLAALPGGLKVVPKNAMSLTGGSEKVVYAGKSENVVAEDLNVLSKKHLFVYPIAKLDHEHAELEKVATVHYVKEGDFAIVEPKSNSELDLAHFAHHETGACGALLRLNENSLVEPIRPVAGKPLISIDTPVDEITKLQSNIEVSSIKAAILGLENMGTRYHKSETGIQVPGYLAEKYQAMIPKERTDVSVELLKVRNSPQKNIVIRIKGSEKPEEVVVLGSHIDSINSSRSKDAPGADDDASGTAVNMEIFKVLMENGVRPKRTIEIHGYAAEEIGLVGSAQLASDYRKNKINVVSMVQFDLALYSDRRGSLDKMFFVSNGTDKEITGNLMKLAKDYLKVEVESRRLSAGTSDHQSWMRKGYAAAFPTENPVAYNRRIHSNQDRLDSLHENAVKFSSLFAKLGVSYVMHYAGF